MSFIQDPDVIKNWREHVQKWLDNRIHIANLVFAQSDGVRFATEFDAEILLCCVISSISAKMWPNQGDAARFVQLLVEHCPIEPHISTISIPVLIASLHGQPEQQVAKEKLWSLTTHQIVTAKSVDKPEGCVFKAVPGLNPAIVRRASYAHVLYKELRCGLIHEYELGNALTDWNLTNVSEPTYFWKEQQPVLYLPYGHILSIVRSTVEAVFDESAKTGNLELRATGNPGWLGKK